MLVVIPHDGDDDAVRIANDSAYGLSGSVDSGDLERAKAVAARIRTGTLAVNGGVWFSADAPFGGYKQSGIGREMGVAGFEEYLETKLIAEPGREDEAQHEHDMDGSRTRSPSSPARRRASARPTPGRWPPRARRSSSPTSTPRPGEKVAAAIDATAAGVFVRTDVSVAESADGDGRRAPSTAYGGIDLLVNNAAIYGDMQFDLLITVDWDYYRKFMSVNMDGALVMTRALLPAHAGARRRRDRQPELDRGVPLLRLLRPGQGRRSTA